MLPIVLGAVAVAAVLGLIGGVVWGLASSGGNAAPPVPLPSQSSASASPTLTSASPTPTLTSASPTPTFTSASPSASASKSPTASASPTISKSPTASPTTSASPTATGIPAYTVDVTSSANWVFNNYTVVAGTGNHLWLNGYIANASATTRSGSFTVYVYKNAVYIGTVTGSLTAQVHTPAGGRGTAITLKSSTALYVSGPTKGFIFVAAP